MLVALAVAAVGGLLVATRTPGDAVDDVTNAVEDTVTTVLEFVPGTYQALVRAGLTTEGALIALAQAALESGMGKTPQARQGFNVFNVAAGTTDQPAVWWGQRPVMVGGDVEYNTNDPSAPPRSIQQRWCVYASYDEAVSEWLKRTAAGRNLTPLNAGDAHGFVYGLYAGKYFTLPPDQYFARLAPFIEQLRGQV
ncbi:MAG: glucosaminidase domain-containing protein [Myxococcaceae bacterium]